MESTPSAAEVLKQLLQPVTVATDSKTALAGSVDVAAHSEDSKKQREHERKAEEAENEGKAHKEMPPLLRRKQGLQALPDAELQSTVRLPYIGLLHRLARGMALTRRGAARGLAEHWGSLKYIQALQAGKGSLLWLSSEGRHIARHYKTLQSEELGQAFALVLAEHILRNRFPGCGVSIVHSDTTLRAGWALTASERDTKDDKSASVGYRYRPHFLAEVWKPSHPSVIIPIACKGNHSGAGVSHDQLASCAAHVDGLHVGTWNQTPGLLFSTELPLEGPVTVHALHAPGDGSRLDLPTGADVADVDLDQPPRQENHFPGIERPTQGDQIFDPLPGCQVRAEHFAWFQETLARTDAAGLMAFAGSGRATARLLTKRQGSEFFKTFEHPSAGSVQDIAHTLLGDEFAGTDHVFRLNGTHVEAFSGVQKNLFEYLADGGDAQSPQVSQWRTQTHHRRSSWPRTGWDSGWGGPVSIHQDGTVLAIRPVSVTKTNR
ncbi:hypothetical protein ACWD3J_06425 [Streptomyces sp. NPDC002755]|uniref:hypothetical protein n=1 Tax=Streptomyces sp. NPDC002884 TaxID=3154544 RepID=UPI0033344878